MLLHLAITLRLNLRSRQALVYGYIVPLFFLVAFASVFHAAQPRLTHQLGMLLTITTLGGACFGMPTAMVAERERGVWQRYRLLPAATGAIVLSTMVTRLILLASAILMQLLAAHWVFGTPWPTAPFRLIAAFVLVAFAFEGLGLVIAMLADNVPAVQALGQCIFLPMIMIGGVGIPLVALPAWAQSVSGYFPGRYAVTLLQSTITTSLTPGGSIGFASIALLGIGIAACVVATLLFRWDSGPRTGGRSRGWVLLALAAWAVVGLAAQTRGRGTMDEALPPPASLPTSQPTASSRPTASSPPTWQQMTLADANAITYDDLQDDSSTVTPIISSPDDIAPAERVWMRSFAPLIAQWPPASDPEPLQRVRSLLNVAAIADLEENPHEAETSYVVFAELQSRIPRDTLVKTVTWIIRQHDAGEVMTSVPALGLDTPVEAAEARDRAAQYAKKLLKRLLGK